MISVTVQNKEGTFTVNCRMCSFGIACGAARGASETLFPTSSYAGSDNLVVAARRAKECFDKF
jgi:hypothetical protein